MWSLRRVYIAILEGVPPSYVSLCKNMRLCVHAIFVIKNRDIREHLNFRDQCNLYGENLKREYICVCFFNATWSFQDHPAACLVMEWDLCVICGGGGDLKCPADSHQKNGLEVYSNFLEAVKEFEELQSLPVNGFLQQF